MREEQIWAVSDGKVEHRLVCDRSGRWWGHDNCAPELLRFIVVKPQGGSVSLVHRGGLRPYTWMPAV